MLNILIKILEFSFSSASFHLVYFGVCYQEHICGKLLLPLGHLTLSSQYVSSCWDHTFFCLFEALSMTMLYQKYQLITTLRLIFPNHPPSPRQIHLCLYILTWG